MKRVLFIFGTRPEAIKMAPLVREFRKYPAEFEAIVCVTAQHREMLDRFLDFFEIVPDFDLNIMEPDQSLFDITSRAVKGLEEVVNRFVPDIIFVQGDTTTAFAGALSGYYTGVTVGHVEAGLRSGDKHAPYPEEMNRVLIGHLADYHFAPTERARDNLAREGIAENVYVVGNTVIDALLLCLDTIRSHGDERYAEFFDFIDFSRKILLVTGHRRESFGGPFQNICNALTDISKQFADVEIVYPVHLNPQVKKPAMAILKDIGNIHLIDPLDYPHLVWLMEKSYLILTDSGGIQEEAPTLGKPVLVMRDVTERTEGIAAHTAELVGTDPARIVARVSTLLGDRDEYGKMARAENPYGDGRSCERITRIIREML
ncbi:MAG: UDP-N-acetylglucosamine 2-epimerase (non-hydrolyzing) [Deltaproteobacteria bacterium]|nr:UDP-N-acetylglucosamine 2-epimerase (non-hydrolyzing) [Deltaproteobacteria bacterium]NIS78266.1 UDP-N-acetylglucosamine 2-epimerase (non-hydrolyzing) [Deltaproteobacteria bacterium]